MAAVTIQCLQNQLTECFYADGCERVRTCNFFGYAVVAIGVAAKRFQTFAHDIPFSTALLTSTPVAAVQIASAKANDAVSIQRVPQHDQAKDIALFVKHVDWSSHRARRIHVCGVVED
jgi:hypothetical protein